MTISGTTKEAWEAYWAERSDVNRNRLIEIYMPLVEKLADRIDLPELFAHSSPSSTPGKPWEPLVDHLRAVAERVATFAGAFGAAALGRYAGFWHDVGKASGRTR